MEDEKRNRAGWSAAAVITSAALTFGCSPSSSVIDPDETTGSISGVSQPAPKTALVPKAACPGIDIRPGASTLNIAVKPNQATAGDLRYQLSFGQTARECQVQDGVMSIKVGVEGRVLLGPFGASGSVDVPLRYAVVREGPEPKLIVAKFKRIRATIAPGKTRVKFLDIEGGLSFPLPSSGELAAYVVYVGFDEIGDKSEKKRTSTTKKQSGREQQKSLASNLNTPAEISDRPSRKNNLALWDPDDNVAR
jgi:hypothetical protein